LTAASVLVHECVYIHHLVGEDSDISYMYI
jgi:hypothetical protein